MKGIVVDIDGKKAAAMTDDGAFVMLPEGVYVLGQEVEIAAEAAETEWKEIRPVKSVSRSRKVWQRAVSIAAALAIAFVGVGTYAYATPYGVVSLDINPSIEYTINRFDRVLSVENKSVDSEISIDLSGLKNSKIDSAVSKTLEQLAESEYLSDSDNYVVMAASTKDDAHTEQVTSRMDTIVADFNERRSLQESSNGNRSSELRAVSVGVSEADARRAEQLNTTPGKLWLIEQAIGEGDEEIDDDDILEMLKLPVREIVEGPGRGRLAEDFPEWLDEDDLEDLQENRPRPGMPQDAPNGRFEPGDPESPDHRNEMKDHPFDDRLDHDDDPDDRDIDDMIEDDFEEDD